MCAYHRSASARPHTPPPAAFSTGSAAITGTLLPAPGRRQRVSGISILRLRLAGYGFAALESRQAGALARGAGDPVVQNLRAIGSHQSVLQV